MRSRIVWLGPLVDEEGLRRHRATSPAANKWQSALLQALGTKRPVEVLSYTPEQVWPRGELRPRASTPNLRDVAIEQVDYLNVFGMRDLDIARRSLRAFRSSCDRHGAPAAVLTYNHRLSSLVVGTYARLQLGVPWIAVVADPVHREMHIPDRMAAFRAANACVFLSWHAFDTYTGRKLHLDGGASWRGVVRDSEHPRRVVYTGAVSVGAGASLIAEAFRELDDPDSELWICGRGMVPELSALAASRSNVKILGFVSAETVEEVCASASVLVNPRLPEDPENRENFPSKILEYLSYGRPIVSTWTRGLAPEYRDLVVVAPSDTVAFAEALRDTLSWGGTKRRQFYESAARFIKGPRSWDAQADKLNAFVDDIAA